MKITATEVQLFQEKNHVTKTWERAKENNSINNFLEKSKYTVKGNFHGQVCSSNYSQPQP